MGINPNLTTRVSVSEINDTFPGFGLIAHQGQGQCCSVEMRAARELSSLLVSSQISATDLQQSSGTLSVQTMAGCQ